MPNITGVTSYFPTVSENTVAMSLGSTILAGATSMTVNGLSNYTAGQWVVFTIDPTSPTLKQVFTGQISGSNQIVNIVWTYAPFGNQPHTAGATIIDYVSATTLDMITTGMLKQHTQAGAHVGLTNTGGATFTGGITTDSLTISGQNTTAGWSPVGQTLNYSANNGQKEFVLTSPSNLTSTLGVGDKLQVTRNTTPPTQCMSFASASSQGANKGSVGASGVTFTAAFTIEAWIYVKSFTGANQTILAYRDASNGFWLDLNTSNQVEIEYASANNFTSVVSWQSVPLNQWVHVAGVISSTSGKTGAIYINGVAQQTYQGAANAATLTQTTTGYMAVGEYALPAGGNYFNGYISEVRLWSQAQTQAAILSNMAISIPPATSGLVGYWQGAGNFNDQTTGANNLTAAGGAIATQAANPYNLVEYGIVTSLSYSSPNTTLTVYTGNSNTIPNMLLTSPQFSVARAPYGFPASKNNWTLTMVFFTNPTPAYTTNGAWVAMPAGQQVVPTGDWRLDYNGYVTGQSSTAANPAVQFQMDTGTPNINRANQYTWEHQPGTTTSNYNTASVRGREPVSNSAITTWTPYGIVTGYSGTATIYFEAFGAHWFLWECAYV